MLMSLSFWSCGRIMERYSHTKIIRQFVLPKCKFFSSLIKPPNSLFLSQEEHRARDLFYALWVPDLFMERVQSDGQWSLFCPNEAPGLADCWGDEFEKLYTKYEREVNPYFIHVYTSSLVTRILVI